MQVILAETLPTLGEINSSYTDPWDGEFGGLYSGGGGTADSFHMLTDNRNPLRDRFQTEWKAVRCNGSADEAGANAMRMRMRCECGVVSGSVERARIPNQI